MRYARKPCRLHPEIAVRPSPLGGRGLFARVAISAGETVLVWGGTFTDAAGAREARAAGRGVMRWDDDLFTIEEPGEEPAYLLNHACDPNVWMADAVTLTARRGIAAGEELTADYALWAADEDYVSAWACRCGAPGCRGRVTGRDWRRADLRAAYRGRFSPLLNRRIAREEAGGQRSRREEPG